MRHTAHAAAAAAGGAQRGCSCIASPGQASLLSEDCSCFDEALEIQSHHDVYLASHAHLRHWMPSLPGHLLMPFARKMRSLSFTNILLEPGLNVLQISSRDH